MNNNIIKVLFLLAKNRPNRVGKCILKCRITYCKQRREFSTGQFVNPIYWNNKQQLVKPPEPDVELVNSQLSLIKTKINRAFLMLQIKEERFNVEDIYSLYRGVKTQKEHNCS